MIHGQWSRGPALAIATALAATASVTGQQPPTVHAAFAASTSDSAPPALAWLRHQLLATRPEWPADGSPDSAFALHVQDGELSFGRALQLPPTVAVAGEFDLGTGPVQFACGSDGSDDWRIEATAVPPAITGLIDALHVEVGGAPRTIDLVALLGNVVGASVDGDARAQQLALGAMQCAEVTFSVTREGTHLRVQGRSGGGLIVPALLLVLARQRDGSEPPRDATDIWRLRAFGGRDGDRAEAARQLQRGGAAGVPALRALLHADEPSRLSAIDGLLRLGAAAELPYIIAAADPGMPMTTAMVQTAVRELWPLASAATRDDARNALQKSRVLDERLLDPPRSDTAATDRRYRWLAVATTLFTGLFGLWLRERLRRR